MILRKDIIGIQRLPVIIEKGAQVDEKELKKQP